MNESYNISARRGIRQNLTKNQPKPLLSINNKSLIQYQIERLVNAGYKEFIINVCYRANDIIEAIGFGDRWGVSIVYSHEGNVALETGGGIKQALLIIRSIFSCKF